MSNRRDDRGSFCKIITFFFYWFLSEFVLQNLDFYAIFSFRLRYVFGKIHPVRIEIVVVPFIDSTLETSTRTLDNTFTHIVNPVLVKSIPGRGLGLCGSFSKDVTCHVSLCIC